MSTSQHNISHETPINDSSQKRPVDRYLWGIYIFMLLVSLVELYSASSREVSSGNILDPLIRHGFMLAASVGIVLFLQRFHYRQFIPYIPLFILASVIMMIYVLFFGDVINGARRSFSFMGIAIQPAEFIKMSSVLGIAFILSRTQSKKGVTNAGIISTAVMVIIFGGLLFTQGLTNTILLMCISLSMMLIGGISFKKLTLTVLIYGVVAGAGLALRSDDDGETNRSGTWQARFERFFDDKVPPIKQPITAKNSQEQYSYFAQANGGITGVGPGHSREAARLPLAFSDYIYAIIIEELGIIGAVIILGVYLALLARAGAIASRCSRALPALLSIGMGVFITFQALFHMAIVTGVFPVSGQPLPLISKGGSSILITSIAFGIMMSVSRYAVRNGKKQEINKEINSLPESVRAENPTQL